MRQYTLNFCFKGSRTYVHGTDVFNKMIKFLDNEIQYINFDLSFHGITKTNIELLRDKPEDESTLKFACKYLDKDDNRNVLYGVENNKHIECRYDYPEEDICLLSDVDLEKQEVILSKNSSFSFIENVVAINKHLLQNIFPNANGKWYFTRLQIKEFPYEKIYPLKLILKANFNFKLTKTEIFIDEKSIGFIYFSLI